MKLRFQPFWHVFSADNFWNSIRTLAVLLGHFETKSWSFLIMFTFLLCYKLKIFGLWHQNYVVRLRIIHLLWGLLVLLNEAPSRGNCVQGFVQEWSDFLWSLKVLEFLQWLLKLLDVVQTENKIPDWILLIQRVFGCFQWFLTCFGEMYKKTDSKQKLIADLSRRKSRSEPKIVVFIWNSSIRSQIRIRSFFIWKPL